MTLALFLIGAGIMFNHHSNSQYSELTLANIEALAEDEESDNPWGLGGTKDCYKKARFYSGATSLMYRYCNPLKKCRDVPANEVDEESQCFDS